METMGARRKKQKVKKGPFEQIKTGLRWIFQIAAVILIAYMLVFFWGQPRTNVGQAMETTLSGGDRVLINTLSYRFGTPKRGDLISFKPNGNKKAQSLIRRVIGLPGETIQIVDGVIYINGRVYMEEQDFPAMTFFGTAKDEIVLGNSEYFVLGDNRNNSEDSRSADIGNVRLSDIEGKVWFVIAPRSHFGLVE